MTKTLTEQWKDGELEKGFYYIKTRWLGCDKKWHYNKEQDIDYLDSDGDWCGVATDSVVEIIGDVPTYDEYKRLQEQLKEANEVIKYYAEGIVEDQEEDENGEVMSYEYPASNDQESASRYLRKWGVK